MCLIPSFPEATTLIDLLRHGEPLGGSCYRGQIDHPLSGRGWWQMWRAVADNPGWQVLGCSDLARCEAFARRLGARHGLPVEVDARWREIGFGRWEGLTVEQIMRSDGAALRRFWADPLRHHPPGGEPFAEFRQRVLSAWEDWLARHRGQHGLLVAHGGVIRVLLCEVLGLAHERMFHLDVGFAGRVRLVIEQGDDWQHARLLFPGQMT